MGGLVRELVVGIATKRLHFMVWKRVGRIVWLQRRAAAGCRTATQGYAHAWFKLGEYHKRGWGVAADQQSHSVVLARPNSGLHLSCSKVAGIGRRGEAFVTVQNIMK